MPIGEPLFEFAAAARMTDLVNFPNGFHRAIIAVATPGNGLGQANGTSFFREATGVPDDASTCGLLALASGIVFVMHRRKNILA